MSDIFSLRPEARYGCPSADQILVNRFYMVGYSYYFRQAKWALDIVDPDKKDMDEVERLNNFRPDCRVPERFRAGLSDYRKSGYDRGHLVASEDLDDEFIQNSETFLLTNMCPQKPEFNRNTWRQLESAIRGLDADPDVLETYVISGPIFSFADPIMMIGEDDRNGVSIPVPSHFYKAVLTEEKSGKLKMWAFQMRNEALEGDLKDYRVSVSYLEQRTGMLLWSNLSGRKIEREKDRIRAMWRY